MDNNNCSQSRKNSTTKDDGTMAVVVPSNPVKPVSILKTGVDASYSSHVAPTTVGDAAAPPPPPLPPPRPRRLSVSSQGSSAGSNTDDNHGTPSKAVMPPNAPQNVRISSQPNIRRIAKQSARADKKAQWNQVPNPMASEVDRCIQKALEQLEPTKSRSNRSSSSKSALSSSPQQSLLGTNQQEPPARKVSMTGATPPPPPISYRKSAKKPSSSAAHSNNVAAASGHVEDTLQQLTSALETVRTATYYEDDELARGSGGGGATANANATVAINRPRKAPKRVPKPSTVPAVIVEEVEEESVRSNGSASERSPRRRRWRKLFGGSSSNP